MGELKEFAGWALAVLLGLIAWLSRRQTAQYDKGLDRIAVLEQTYVSQDDLERAMAKFTAERIAMHQENKELLRHIESKMDENEERRSKTEHEIRDAVHSVQVQMAVLTDRSKVQQSGDGR